MEPLSNIPEQTLRYQLNWAVKNSHHERAKLLINHGAELTTKRGEKSLYESAMLAGDEALAEYLDRDRCRAN